MAQDDLSTKNSADGPDPMHVSAEGVGQEINQSSSDSDVRQSTSVDLSAHSTPFSQADARDEDETGDFMGISEDKREEKETKLYWDTVSAFASDITTAARDALLTGRKGYTRVIAVIVYWMNAKKSSLPADRR